MSTIVLITAEKGFGLPSALKPIASASGHRHSDSSAAVMCALAMLRDTYLLLLITIFCSLKHLLTTL